MPHANPLVERAEGHCLVETENRGEYTVQEFRKWNIYHSLAFGCFETPFFRQNGSATKT